MYRMIHTVLGATTSGNTTTSRTTTNICASGMSIAFFIMVHMVCTFDTYIK